ncbi:2-hydroxyacid dehydrogenase [Nostocoides sp. F2B08]|uniref:2-hydroxyacid dehydrogenase n=1 Tax=Nostocoides sp. F2B08 TaxID=2653936 RepID=UPI001D056E41|nr:2-hydroxyacid dehydrogenase [Tetrasphaera sp. F2B08]
MSSSSSLVVSLPDVEWIEAVGPVEGTELVVAGLLDVPERAAEIEVCVPPYMRRYDRALLRAMPALHLVQLLTAGYDGVLEVLPEGVSLANAVGVHDTSTAELAVALTLASLRGIPQFVRDGLEGRWAAPMIYDALADLRVVVLGYGAIGRAVTRRLLPFEVRVEAVASRPRAGDDLVDRVHGIDDLPALLAGTDVLVVSVPLSEATHHLVDDGLLAALPDGALVVNVARGGVADTDAILAHAKRLRFALDVTDPEPLPPDHPLWREPNVLISPHTGGPTTAFRPRAVRFLREQLTAYVQTGTVPHIVAGPGRG